MSNRITECIILAGGKGTRLASVVADKPKCLADVGGLPFSHYLLKYLQTQGITKIVYSVGYLSDQVIAWANEHTNSFGMQHVFAKEEEPLGTGGAIIFALKQCSTNDVLVVNGDTMFAIDVQNMASLHYAKAGAMCIALKPMQHFDRYGIVVTDEHGAITNFAEKQATEYGLINGGVYIINKPSLLSVPFAERFGFEQDYLVKAPSYGHQLWGYSSDAYFIDIGIPEDYDRANTELPQLLAQWTG